ncbi:MAG: cohesin domain-containing protein [bacterium]
MKKIIFLGLVVIGIIGGIGKGFAWNNIEGGDHGGADWIINANTEIAGVHTNVNIFTVLSGVTVHIKDYDGNNYGSVSVIANTIEIHGTITGSGSGYYGGIGGPPQNGRGADGEGTGGGMGNGSAGGGAGAGYGGKGGNGGNFSHGNGIGGDSYDLKNEVLIGSGGGGGGGSANIWDSGGNGGDGGGALILIAQNNITIEGAIKMDGQNGEDGKGENGGSSQRSGGGGGGSGGGILIKSLTGMVTINGVLTANGGKGGNAWDPASGGGGGGGGRIKICASSVLKGQEAILTVEKGVKGFGRLNGEDGNVGIITGISQIIINPSSGAVGSIVTLTGTDFGPTELIRIDFGNKITITTITSSSGGTFSCTFTSDTQPYGTTTVMATGLTSGISASTSFNILPKITMVMPTTGTVGSIVTVWGNGFGGNEDVRIDFGTTLMITSIPATLQGTFATTFTVDTQPYGTTTIRASGLSTGGSAFGTFRIVSSIICISPYIGSVGTRVTIWGNGYGALELVRIDFGRTRSICTVFSNSSGTFSALFTVDIQPHGTTSIGCYGLTSGLQSMSLFFIRGSIIISPIAGTVGSSVTVIGNGFGATEMIMISFGSVVSLTTASTTGNGNFNTTFIVNTQPFGNTTISVIGLITQERVSERFTILPNIIFVTPTSGTIGSKVTVMGNGFGASSCIRIAFGTTRTIAIGTSNAMGVFQCVFTVNTQPLGTTTIIAFDDRLAIWVMARFNIFSRTILRIIPASQNVALNQEFTVNIEVVNVNRLITAGTYLSFNPAILEVVEMGTGTFIPNPLVMIKKFENGTGTIDYAVGIATDSVTGSGTLCTVKFRAKASGSSSVVFDSDTLHNRNTILIDVDVHEIPCRKESGNYYIIGSLYVEPQNAVVRAGVPTVYNCYAVCAEATITVTGSTTFTVSGGGSFTLNSFFPYFIGTHTITATYLGAIATTLVIITPGTPTQLVKVSGDNQIGTCTTTLPNPFVVKVIDTYSNPCPDVQVGWMITSVPSGASGYSILPTQTLTTSAGRAEGWLTLGTEPPGTYTVNATSTGLTGSPCQFTAHSLRRFGNIAGFCLLDQGTSTLLGTQGVTITITELGTSTTTNPQGYFILNNINVGTYTLYFDTYGASPLTVTGTCISPTQINDTTDIGTKTLLSGDITNDGLVNSLDWPYFVNACGKYEAQGDPDWWTIYREGDFDHDTYVNVKDFPVYYYNYGRTQAGRMRSPAMAAMKEKRMTAERITLSFEIEAVDDVDINDLRLGDIIKLKVFINDAKNYFGGEMHLGFNSEILQVIGVIPGEFSQQADKVVIYNVDNTQGLIDYTLLLWSPETEQDSGLLATIPFKVIKGGGYSTIEFDYDEDDNRKTIFVEQWINEEQKPEIILPDVVDDEVTITVPRLYENLESVIAYPNPAHKGDTVHFTNIPNNRTVNLKIFNIAGELVYEGEVKNQNEITWDLKNKDKNEVASGIYIFLLNDKVSPVKKGKIGVIK